VEPGSSWEQWHFAKQPGSINIAGATVLLLGNSLMLNLPMTFNSAFSGSRNIYLDAAEAEGANSGWQTRGTWTVPGTALSLTADLVTPNSGPGSEPGVCVAILGHGRSLQPVHGVSVVQRHVCQQLDQLLPAVLQPLRQYVEPGERRRLLLDRSACRASPRSAMREHSSSAVWRRPQQDWQQHRAPRGYAW
jgi:hypothetical protein